ncbi:MAG: hypothetical protein RI906_178, partial [Pseudomonadota bacterium]
IKCGKGQDTLAIAVVGECNVKLCLLRPTAEWVSGLKLLKKFDCLREIRYRKLVFGFGI